MNLVRTGILLATMTALFVAVGFLIGGQSGMLVAFVVAMGMNVFSYWNSDTMVLRMQDAREVDASSAPEYVALVRQLTTNAGLPMPRTYVMHSPQPNAFATGRNPEHAAICATTGLFELLSMEEIAGVLGHELAHVKHRDTLTMTVTATLAGAIGMLANFAQFGAIFGGNRNGDRRLGWLGVLAVSLLAPMAAGIVQMAISRSREYDADRLGAQICRNPLWLASALRKINDYARQIPNEAAQDNPAMAHLYIINPLHGGMRDSLFSTHPDTENRIAALVELAREMGETPAGGPDHAAPSFSDARKNPIVGDRGGGSAFGSGPGQARGPWDQT